MKHTVIYDGSCGICTAAARYILKKDKKRIFDIAPYQFTDLKAINENLDEDKASRQVYLAMAGGRLYGGSRAVFEIAKRMPFPWKLGGIFANSSAALFNPFYRLIARNRAKISQWLGMTKCDL
ncbi:MAG: thiol-disulfide oxidoreductase DCC family protein [Candidatus Kapaibacterium sp.]